jgi:hypothetical protein
MTEPKRRLVDRILAARKQLRINSGGPLTDEGREEQRRDKEVAALENEAYRIGMDSEMTLRCAAA